MLQQKRWRDTLFNIFYSKCPQSVSAANKLTTQWRVVPGMQLPLTVGQQQSCSSSVFLLCSKVAIDQVAASLEQNKADHVSSKKWHLKAEFSQRPHFKTKSNFNHEWNGRPSFFSLVLYVCAATLNDETSWSRCIVWHFLWKLPSGEKSVNTQVNARLNPKKDQHLNRNWVN